MEQNLGFNETIGRKKYQIFYGEKDWQNALKVSDKLASLDEENIAYYELKYETLIAMGNEAEAIQILENLLQRNPNSGFALLALADYYKNQDQLERSDEYLFRAFSLADVALEGKTRIVNGMLGYVGQSPEIIPRIKRLSEILVDVHPNSGHVHAIHGDIFSLDRRWEEAYSAYRTSLNIEAANPAVWIKLLSVSNNQRNYKLLQKDAEEALEFYPNNESFLFSWGVSSIELGDYDEAKYALEKVKKLNTGNRALLAESLAELGRMYHLQGEHTTADANFEEALEHDPSNPRVLHVYAYTLGKRKEKNEEALEMAKKAVELNPNSAQFLDTYAWLLNQSGAYADARKLVEKALGIEENPLFLEHYGDILRNLGDKNAAVKTWERARELGARIDIDAKLQ